MKTGTDADAALVNVGATTPTTIATMRSYSPPASLPANNRIQPQETSVYSIDATLTEYKLETDSDYHLVIQDGSGSTMITEIPDPACAAGSLFLTSIQSSRSEFDAKFTATGSFKVTSVPVRVRGIGFFDFLHGQTGVAPNGIELHPVLDILFNPPPPAPTVDSVIPNNGPTAGGTSVTITGTNFTGVTAVKFGPVAATTYTVNSTTQITATSPPGSGVVDVTVTTANGTNAISAADKFAYTLPPAAYTAVRPVRLMDTRSAGGPLRPGGFRDLPVAGVTPGALAGATGVVLNVTATNTTAPSYLTVYPAGATQPLASNLNWLAGQTVPNLVSVQVGTGGAVTFYNAFGSTDVVVDLEGYFAAPSGTAGGEVALTPARITDTRPASGQPNASNTLGVAGIITVQVTGAGGVPPAGVSGAILNVTVTNTTAPSFLTIWPAGQSNPLASNLNWTPGLTMANRVFVPVSAGTGQVQIYNKFGSVDVIVDVSGYFTDATATGKLFTPVSPLRLVDTRSSGQTLGAGLTFNLQVSGISGVPSGATAVILNVTVTNTTAPSYLTVFPSTAALPTASDVNWVGGQTVPNMVVVTLGTTGAITFYNSAGSTDVVVDVAGWFS